MRNVLRIARMQTHCFTNVVCKRDLQVMILVLSCLFLHTADTLLEEVNLRNDSIFQQFGSCSLESCVL